MAGPTVGKLSSSDHPINPDVERFGYERAGVDAIELDSAHLVMLSHAKQVADVIREAIAAVANA
jgi:hypothetical protein